MHTALVLSLAALACGLMLPCASTALQVTPAGTPSKLSPRLALLADLAAAGSLPADVGEQDRLLSVAGSGAGSLSRDVAGNPIVEARVLDASDQTIASVTALPADVLSVAPEYATITLAVAPARLGDLASLAAVQYVSEVIRPSTNPDGGPGGFPGGAPAQSPGGAPGGNGDVTVGR